MPDEPELVPSEPTPEPERPRRWHKVLLRTGIGLGIGVVGVGVVAFVWGDRIVTELLLPRISASVDNAIKRPTELGDVEGFSFWGVKLGKTVIPPTESDKLRRLWWTRLR